MVQSAPNTMSRKAVSEEGTEYAKTVEKVGIFDERNANEKSSDDCYDGEIIERVRVVIKDAHVFKLPARPSSGGWRGADWRDEVWQGAVKIVERGDATLVLLVDPRSSRIFAVCPINYDGGYNAVDRCVDSSRYFVLRIVNGNGRHMFIGLAFNERNDAFDFNTSLEDARREREFAKKPVQTFQNVPSKDYSMKEGEKIHVNVKNIIGGSGKRERKNVNKSSTSKKGFLIKPSSKDTPRR